MQKWGVYTSLYSGFLLKYADSYCAFFRLRHSLAAFNFQFFTFLKSIHILTRAQYLITTMYKHTLAPLLASINFMEANVLQQHSMLQPSWWLVYIPREDCLLPWFTKLAAVLDQSCKVHILGGSSILISPVLGRGAAFSLRTSQVPVVWTCAAILESDYKMHNNKIILSYCLGLISLCLSF